MIETHIDFLKWQVCEYNKIVKPANGFVCDACKNRRYFAFINEAGEDLFSFPEGIPDVQRYKQFGNSVTIPVIQTMAEFMLVCIGILGEA